MSFHRFVDHFIKRKTNLIYNKSGQKEKASLKVTAILYQMKTPRTFRTKKLICREKKLAVLSILMLN